LTEFFRVVTPGRILEMFPSFGRLGSETVRLQDSLGRVLAEAIIASEDLPPWPRATMDGYAVRAQDTFGATDSLPGLLRIAGRVEMGKVPEFTVGAGEAAEIPTGGFLPAGADSVLMVEYANPAGEGDIEISRPVTMGENVLGRGEDVSRGDVLASPGRRIRPQDMGMMAGLGKTEVRVFRRPKVALLSTGNEVVPIDRNPAPGQIRDTNSYSVSALVRSAGAEVITLGIVPDDVVRLREIILRGISISDVVAASGGSSVGERDLMANVIASLPNARILAHGVAISPGKPTLLASVEGKALFVLPGHPVSAMIIAAVFLLPFLRFLEGEDIAAGLAGRKVEAVLATSISSVPGREEYVRARLEHRDGRRYAHPVFGKSSMLSTMVRSDGLICVPIHAEGIAGGETVEVILF
jgi:molybdopterin molybdotransferase